MSKIAVIKTGGKQYVVAEGDKLKIEKLEGEAGGKIKFDDVLLIADGKNVELGQPALKNTVEAEILEQKRDKKILVIKYKAKTRYLRRKGHRQHQTVVKINSIK